jgi:hypothetical protein
VARRRAAARPRARCAADSCPGAGTGEADIDAVGSIWQPPVSPRCSAETTIRPANDIDRSHVLDTPGELVELFCQALVSRRDDIVWDIGGVHQAPLPLERMVKESPTTPLDVPMHPRAPHPAHQRSRLQFGMSKRRWLAAGGSVLAPTIGLSDAATGASASTASPVVGYTYIDGNTTTANTIDGFARHADGSVTPLPGSPFAAGGAGR